MAETLRSFIAFELPEKIISSIRKVQEEIKAYGFAMRWVRPENIHLTLKFLGNINQADIPEIRKRMSETAEKYSPMRLAAKGIGVFPGIKRPRVLWVGLNGQIDSLIGLQKTIDEKLEAIGLPRENRAFKGHLTLARVKGHIDSNRLGEAMKEVGGFESEAFIVDQIVLFKSELKPGGSVYTKLMSISL
ncbi:MAG TPA: RNA 2',3'-cyclic phosphodiesterase [Desulfobacterales bacterium]|nr:RNA 2',3'-cyclic phosphodiesterase [Desulfobacterales bacterium]